MNYDGAEGLEFGGGNTKIDPSVLAGQSEIPEDRRVAANGAKSCPKGVASYLQKAMG